MCINQALLDEIFRKSCTERLAATQLFYHCLIIRITIFVFTAVLLARLLARECLHNVISPFASTYCIYVMAIGTGVARAASATLVLRQRIFSAAFSTIHELSVAAMNANPYVYI